MDICEECLDRLPPYRNLVTAQMVNLARCVLEYTEVVRYHNGKRRCRTYRADIDAIADASRHLAAMVAGLAIHQSDGTTDKPR